MDWQEYLEESLTHRRNSARNVTLFLVALVLLLATATEIHSQQQPQNQSSTPGQTPGQRSRAEIVADNLDHVAATADHILEVLNRDAGLMVELKRMLAEDAGANGQLLEETDLSEATIGERLRQELHTRVLATRLLQRYGYLLPKVNPDSDLAAQHNLEMRARAQEMERASESRSSARAAPQTVITVGTPTSVERPANQGRPVRQPLSGIDGAMDYSRPEILTAPTDPRMDLVKTGAKESLQTEPVVPGEMLMTGAETPAAPALRPTRGVAMKAAEFEPVRMDRRPNPYADVPSLYDLYVQANSPNLKMERFGLEVFRNGAADPDILPMDLPVGQDYVVGPGDSLSINLWGGVSQRLLRTVDREGRLLLPEAGPLLVSGKSLGEVQESVQRVLRTQFRDVSADVSLLRLRTVRVYVVGEVSSPGAYDVSSLSTPLNALFAAGGVTPRGSLRRVEHYRGKQLLEDVDAYDLLLHGIRGDAKRIENGDSLRVPPLGPTVTVDGMVRRPSIYELRKEKNLSEVLELAGGILPAAALRHIEVQRLLAHQKRTMLSLDIAETSDPEAVSAQLGKFDVQDGDEVHIFPIAPYNTGAVYLEGHVLRPGRYSYREGMKLTDLVTSYKDLLPEPAVRYAEIVRLVAPDNRPVVESFDLSNAIEHAESAPKLLPLDTVRIFGRYDFEPLPEFSVFGEVRAPGNYRASGRQHLRDAIYQAGGITPDAWLEATQLFRLMPDGTTKVFSVSLRDALAGDALNNILIEPRDRILVHRLPERVNPPSVFVHGEVARAGRYPLVAGMRVSGLVRTAGGLLRSANPTSGDLTHYATASGTSAIPSGEQPVNLAAALAGNPAEDAPLRDGDVLTIPQQTGWKNVGATVTLKGEVAKPGVYGIQPSEPVSSLLRRAGGFLPTAYPRAAVFERTDVYQMQQKSKQELIQRLEQESITVKTAISTTGSEEAALQQAALQQRQRMLEGLRRAPVSGRMVVHLQQNQKGFAGSPDDIELRAGDILEIPKQPGFVVIVGQVYNSNAITASPGKNASWYLSRAGGVTPLANKRAIFIIRANGSVSSGGSLWSGGVLSAAIGPGDTIVVPEKAVLGGSSWKNVVSIAQIAQAAALAAAVAIP